MNKNPPKVPGTFTFLNILTFWLRYERILPTTRMSCIYSDLYIGNYNFHNFGGVVVAFLFQKEEK